MPFYAQQPAGRPAFLRIAVFTFIIVISFITFIGFIITLGFITIAQSQNLQRIYSKRSPPGCFYSPSEGLDYRRDRCRLTWCDIALGKRRGDRLHRGGDIAARVRASASPARSAAAASVALLREPGRRPAGLPDRPFSNGRPRTRAGSFVNSTSDMIIRLVRPAAHFRRRGR